MHKNGTGYGLENIQNAQTPKRPALATKYHEINFSNPYHEINFSILHIVKIYLSPGYGFALVKI